MSVWVNKKNQRLYEVFHDTASNVTNAQCGQRMVLYRSSDGVTYVRQYDEFMEKFEPAEKHSMYVPPDLRTADTKMVIVVRKDLKMPVGKIAAQVAHAAMGALLQRGEWAGADMYLLHNLSDAECGWLRYKFTKIVLWCDSLEELDAINKAAISEGLGTRVITDAGDTVFGGVPTVTCAAIGPDWPEKINKVTGHLKLAW